MKRILVIAAFVSLFFSCKTAQQTASTPEPVIIKIVQINDVYEIDAINAGKAGGLARVAYIKDSIQNRYPNTYLFLAGDFLNPSLIGTIKVDGERLQGKQIVEVLNASGLDLVTFGNHEFDIKEADLQKRLNESEFDWTSANVLQVTESGDRPFRIQNPTRNEEVSDYKIYTVSNPHGEDIKFGVFGVTIPSNPKAFVVYGDIYEEAVRAHKAASAESDFVVGLTHVSIDQDKEIARRIEDLPLIMGGHEHYHMIENVNGTVIAKADANAVSLFVHTFTYEPDSKNLTFDSELVMVTDAYPSQPEVQEIVNRWTKLLDENLETIVANPNKVIYHSEEALDGTDEASRSKQTNLGGIINKSMAMALEDQPDGVISNGGGIRIDDVLTGDLTSKDVFRILPYGGKVVQVEMTGALLESVLDFGVAASGTGAYLQRYNLDPADGGGWLVSGKPLDTSKNYTIAMNDFLMMGLDIPFLTAEHEGVLSVIEPTETESAYDLRKCIIEYLKQ